MKPGVDFPAWLAPAAPDHGRHGNALSLEVVERILALEAEGLTRREIAARCRVHANTVAKYLAIANRPIAHKHYPPTVRERRARMAKLLAELNSRNIQPHRLSHMRAALVGEVARALGVSRRIAKTYVRGARSLRR